MADNFRASHLLAVALSVGLHVLALVLVGPLGRQPEREPEAKLEVVVIDLQPETPEPPKPAPEPEPAPPEAAPVALVPRPAIEPLPSPSQAQPVPEWAQQPHATERSPVRIEAPPAPTAEEWAQASTYTLKNSKRYRYTWAQQVRSMMGAAVEGPDQGMVRFRIEIAPSGRLVSVETLWSTSSRAEALARQAMEQLPPLPPTPTGQSLVFEKTISFHPFANDAPPIYKDDCLPDPPRFVNPYAWDGRSPPGPAVQPTGEKLDPEALAECLKQLPQDSVEAEAAHDQRQLERWRSDRLGLEP
jgi:TonB family protein